MPSFERPRGTEDVLREHEEQIRRLGNTRTLENATIGSGGILLDGGSITIRDDNGQDRAVIGALGTDASGEEQFGIGVVGASGVTTFDQIAFGTKVAKNASEVSFGVGQTHPKNQWVWGAGPDIEGVWVTGGRLTTVVSAYVHLEGGPGTMYVGAGLLAPTGIIAPDWSDCLALDFRGSGMGTAMAASREVVFTGLANGYYHIRTGYYLGALGDPGAVSQIKSRSISARLT